MRFEPVHIGKDFNVGHMAAVAAEHHNGKLYVMKEFVDYLDTPDLITGINDEFGRRKIISYPDSTGIKRASTNAASSDIKLLKNAGFTVRARSINPSVRDRIASVNRAFEQKKLFINTEACPELTDALEQQIYLANGSPDKSSGQDHVLDALGYMVYYLMPINSRGVIKMGVAH
jgi:hypothetical protein